MALLWLLVLLALAGPVGGTGDTCKGTCGLRPLNSDHSSAGTSREGGTSVQPGAWPGIVSIQATWENGTWHMCTGVLLSSQWVLTVAHCFARAGGISTWDVVIGATDLRQRGPGAVVRRIQRLLVHQRYVTATARNDIALVELDQPVECSNYIQLGCVPDPSLRVSELKSCYIAGWKFARAQGTAMVLQEAKVHLMDTQLCNSSRWYAGAVHADNLCAGYPQGGIDTCKGDSGGPLVCKDNAADYYWLVGLNSWGRGCDRARHPGIYTSTQHFYNWILIQTSLSPADISGTAPEPKCAPTPKAEFTIASEEAPTPGPEQEAQTEPTPVPEPTPELVVPGPGPVTDMPPAPELVTELMPEPELVPVPVPTPEPELMPEPEPVPVPVPTPEPELMPEPEPVPQPTPEPELVTNLVPVPVPDLTPEPTTVPTTVPTTAPTTVPTTVPTTAPTTVPVPEPSLVPKATPEPEEETELVPEPEQELMPAPTTPEPTILPEPEELAPSPEPEPTQAADRLLLISVPYQSLLQFCNLLRDFLLFLRSQLG